MDKSRIKNFIIIILLLVNIFLLVIVMQNSIEKRRAETYRKDAIVKVLSDKGIALNPKIKLPDKIPNQISLRRNMDAELKMISALLGNCKVNDQGGNIYYYKGSDGEAKFRGNGEFEILLKAGVIQTGKNPVESAVVALRKLGIEYSDDIPIIEIDGNNTTVIMNCSWDKTPIYNTKISFFFNSENLMLITGSRAFDDKYYVQNSEDYLDSITVLMNFLTVWQAGDVCSRIDDLETGYFHYSTVSGDCILKPMWLIKTDSKYFYIDAQTGLLETIENAS